MTIQVRFFASLREALGRDGADIALPAGARIADVWCAVTGTQALPAGILCARQSRLRRPGCGGARRRRSGVFPAGHRRLR